MSLEIFDDLPAENDAAFLYLEAHYRQELEKHVDGSDENSVIMYYKSKFMNNVIAAAKALEIEYIRDFDTPTLGTVDWSVFEDFDSNLSNIKIQIGIAHSRRKRSYSVSLSSQDKEKIRLYLENIKKIILESDLDESKKDGILKKITILEDEVSRNRTRFDIIADSVRSFSRLGNDFEREGMRPYWKWVSLLLGVVDKTKEKEDTAISGPADRKRIEPPKRRLPPPERSERKSDDLDDDIPF